VQGLFEPANPYGSIQISRTVLEKPPYDERTVYGCVSVSGSAARLIKFYPQVRACKCIVFEKLINLAETPVVSRDLVHVFRQRTLILLKALMLQKRVRYESDGMEPASQRPGVDYVLWAPSREVMHIPVFPRYLDARWNRFPQIPDHSR